MQTEKVRQRAWDKFPNLRPNITSDAEEVIRSKEGNERREEVEY